MWLQTRGPETEEQRFGRIFLTILGRRDANGALAVFEP